jgi:hypothetical protein
MSLTFVRWGIIVTYMLHMYISVTYGRLDSGPFRTNFTLEEAAITPGRFPMHSDTRIRPLPLINSHGRYITVASERKLVSVGEWPLHITVLNL